jgi:hypothetical protein
LRKIISNNKGAFEAAAKNVNLFRTGLFFDKPKMIFFPTHVDGNHWILVVADTTLTPKTLKCYDSLYERTYTEMFAAIQLLMYFRAQVERLSNGSARFDPEDWVFHPKVDPASSKFIG